MIWRTFSRRRPRGVAIPTVAAIAALASVLSIREAAAQQTIPLPANRGDQVLFFFDARSGRTPFLTVANPSGTAVVIEIAFYPATLASRLGQEVRTLAGAGNTVIDPTEAAGGAANGSAGLVIVTPIASAENPTPVVPPQPLVGGFTLANTALQSAFGENAFGRLAVKANGERGNAGAVVDGSTVRYQRFVPGTLMVPAYFNPNSLGPVDQDGNRVVLVSFSDQYGTRFDPSARAVTAKAHFFNGAGATVGTTRDVGVDGVQLSNLQAIAGEGVLTSSGKVFFEIDAGTTGSAFGLFSQSLGTFASGQRMPSVSAVPAPSPVPTPTGPTPTPGKTPTPTGPVITPTGGGGTCIAGDKVKVTVAVNWNTQTPPGQPLASSVALRLDYPESKVEIPGTNSDQSVQDRIEYVTPADLTSGFFSGVDDLDSVLAVGGAVVPEAIPTGNFVRVTFDCKAGPVPAAGDFSCSAPADGTGDANGQAYLNPSCSVAQVAKQ